MYLLNAFSISMLPEGDTECGQGVAFRPLTVEGVARILNENTWESAVGHQSTADLFSNLLGLEVKTNRISVTLKEKRNWDELSGIVGQYSGPRLEEGATELPPGASVKWFGVEILYPGNSGDLMDGSPIWC